jgi:formate transporter
MPGQWECRFFGAVTGRRLIPKNQESEQSGKKAFAPVFSDTDPAVVFPIQDIRISNEASVFLLSCWIHRASLGRSRRDFMSNYLTPSEISRSFVETGIKKASLGIAELFLLGILAGVYIGFAAHIATVVATGHTEWYGIQRFFVGSVFSLGLILVVIAGSELWTGNTMMSMALLERRITLAMVLRNWFFVYAGNFAGSLMLAWIIAHSSGLLNGASGGTAIKIAYGKLAEQIPGASHNSAFFFRGIGCNWLVCLALMLAAASKDISGKILGIYFPIMAFVASSFEHCVANMYYIPAGIFAAGFDAARTASGLDAAALSSLTWSAMFTNNIIAVTLGNFVGGSIFTGAAYWWLYVRREKKLSPGVSAENV